MKQAIAILLSVLFSVSLIAQSTKEENKVREVLSRRGEAKILVSASKNEIGNLGNVVSIDAKNGDKWLCYVNEKEFNNFLTLNLPYQACIEDNQSKALTMANAVNQMSSWDRYPSYEVYDTMMRNFAIAYPQLCRLDTIGITVEGRLLLCLKISDSVSETQNEPKFFYSSSMHGDELTGAIMLLQMADYLLSNYNSDSRIANIVNGIELYICPLANPDGTYSGGNSTVSQATRYNANYVDLNRNYPSPKRGNHPDGNNWQSETLAFMDYAAAKEFDININLHGGAEVCNYPFDDYLPSNEKSHADNQWFIEICQRFMDTLWHNAPTNYFVDVASSGYILGYDWYPAPGSRQDYHTYFLHQREITLEVSSTKTPSSSNLPTYWNRLRSALLCFVEECFTGINGVVKDSLTGETLDNVFIYISEYDRDSSQIYSKANGYFFRPLHNGQYSLTFEKQGYVTKTLNFNLQQNNLIFSDVLLVSTNASDEMVNDIETLAIYPNPSSAQINVTTSSSGSFFIANMAGKRLMEGKLQQGDNLIDVRESLENGYYCFVFAESKSGKMITKPLVILNK
ncbi:MAG: carboxypeptidase regulatory-like domain-containing protein [Bacteroidales bacterium]|jgi:hypothetical protein|nr:carboxypeptidase regulatory-like domain-containing protein [Bacteroidales bacterium]